MSDQPTRIESALARPRESLVVVLIILPLVCWLWVISMARDMYGPMTGASAWMMTVEWDAPRLLLLWAMWAAMMAGMMLPTAAPIMLLYARTRAQPAERAPGAGARIYALASGYTSVWLLFSVAATALQRLLASALLLTPMMEPASPRRRGSAAGHCRRLSAHAAKSRLPASVPIADRVLRHALA